MSRLFPLLVLPFLAQEPRLRDGYVTPDRAERLAAPGEKPPAVKLAVIPLQWIDFKAPQSLSRQQVERMIFSRAEYRDRNRLNQPVFGSLADWVAENSAESFALTGTVFDWVTVETEWDAIEKGAAVDEGALVRSVVDIVASREGEAAFDGVTHAMVFYFGSRSAVAPGHPLRPHVTRAKLGAREVPLAILDANLQATTGNLAQATGVGALAHELGHLLGLDDAHGAPGSRGLGPWCVMSAMFHADTPALNAVIPDGGQRPVHLCAVCKERLGWVRPAAVDPKTAQKIALRPAERWPDILKLPSGAGEHYLLENRQRRGFDRNLAATGLFLWHVKGAAHDLVAAHGLVVADASTRFVPAVPFPALHSIAFTPETRPASRGGVVLREMDVDDGGVAYVTVGGPAVPAETARLDGVAYRIAPGRPRFSTGRLDVAVVAADFSDAPSAGTPMAALRAAVFEHGPRLQGRSLTSAADAMLQLSGGAVGFGGAITPSWVRVSKSQADCAKLRGPDLAREIAAAGAETVAKADVVVLALAGRPRPNTALTKHAGIARIGDRDVVYWLTFESELMDDGPAIAGAAARLFRVEEHGTPRTRWCMQGPSVPCAWCRERAEWLEPLVAAESGRFAVAPAALAPNAVKVPLGDGEYFLIENRTAWELDRAVFREGLVIWHVTPADRKCFDCFEGALDVWLAHGPIPRDKTQDGAARYTPFLSLPQKGFSLRLAGGKVDVSGIKADARGNLYFELELAK